MTYTIITGATAGIGYELAKTCAKHGEKLILVGRNKDKLKKVKDKLSKLVETQAIVADLAKPGISEKIHAEVKAKGYKISTLINNAGFGDHSPFGESDNKKNVDMIQVNVTALTELCRFFINDIEEGGHIVNVASVAGFIPGPYMATYFATKAYVISFSVALNEEREDITVSTICPGPTKTEFEEKAKTKFEGKTMTAKEVARIGYEGYKKDKIIIVTGGKNRMLAGLSSMIPKKWAAKMVGDMNKSGK